jgi:hypothetical protein
MYRHSANAASIIRIADGACIPVDPKNVDYADYLRWIENGNAPESLAVPIPAQSDYEAAIDRHLSLVAAERGYKSEASNLSYRDSSIAAWAAEAKAYALWRDRVWAAAYAALADVQSGNTKAPSPTELLSTLPAISWPST